MAGGLLIGGEGVLLVQNRRRNGSLDWSTPGGVIDEGETLLEGLTREVSEETGLVVAAWPTLAYCVEVDFADRAMTLRVESHVAGPWTGELVVDDPDGIVVDVGFVGVERAVERVGSGPRWVAEPLTAWLHGEGQGQTFRYVARGADPSSLTVDRL